jgi:maleate cis-trans isomerase
MPVRPGPERQSHWRIGLLLPSSNTTQEPEFSRMLPDSVSLHVTRLPLRTIEPSSTAKIVEDIDAESRKLADAAVDAIVLAATAPSSRNGLGYDQQLIQRIQTASGCKATTASTALLQALGVLGVQRLVIAAPWADAVNATVASFIGANGFNVLAHRALGHVSNLEVGALDEQTAYDLGRAVDQADAQAILLACGNWRTLSVVDRLEADIGKPVLTTNQVSLWAVLRLAGYDHPISGCGRLLREYMSHEHANGNTVDADKRTDAG